MRPGAPGPRGGSGASGGRERRPFSSRTRGVSPRPGTKDGLSQAALPRGRRQNVSPGPVPGSRACSAVSGHWSLDGGRLPLALCPAGTVLRVPTPAGPGRLVLVGIGNEVKTRLAFPKGPSGCPQRPARQPAGGEKRRPERPLFPGPDRATLASPTGGASLVQRAGPSVPLSFSGSLPALPASGGKAAAGRGRFGQI